MLFSRLGRISAMAACGLGLGGSLVAQLDFPTLCAKIMPRSKTKGFAWRSWREYEVEQVCGTC